MKTKEPLITDDGDGNPISNVDLYNWMFNELPEWEQKEFLGKPLNWNDGLIIYPDGTVKRKVKINFKFHKKD
jgi:hypothetical protein